MTADGNADGEPLLAIDGLGARANDLVILTNDGAAAREMVKARNGDQKVMIVFIPAVWVTTSGIVMPKSTPIIPPIPESRTVSTRN